MITRTDTLPYSPDTTVEHLPTPNGGNNYAPVIEPIQKEAAREAVNKMRDDIQDNWFSPAGDVTTQEQTDWNRRCDNTLSICDAMVGVLNDPFSSDLYLACTVDGSLAGLVLLDTSGRKSAQPYIGYMVTHPGSQGGGALLIEAAVQLSLEAGHQGQLTLLAENQNAQSVFEHLGFNKDSSGYMQLAPLDNDKWSYLNGRYQLNKHPETISPESR